ncbi:hypothetical protein PNEG_03499 [Pneumocystis murina B123]|uniref:CTLH domain-containing protein n=1 Tax=Pneumocystis murina (strain B123) TaxID=1069680 RepID=M7PC56_PNEMU|nr:hypothetical protein PNEG_03499 [Pneumocystis murina B123]EMR08059.1 hypothetical protein PNEG_03499 [Pneumocystis murina B123]
MASRTLLETKRFAPEEWKRRCEQIDPSKTALNYLILNFFIIEGYESSALKFIEEAHLSPPEGLEWMSERMDILNAIYRGDIISAIEKMNEMDPELLDTRPTIHFMLLRLQLIELIRIALYSPDTDLMPILEFAEIHLAPRAPKNAGFLQDLESAMALLCFSSNNLIPALKPLLDLSLRKAVASNVNTAILEAQGLIQESKIKTLLRLWGWSEKKLRKELEFPTFNFTDN